MSNENKQPDEREMNRYLVAQDDPNREAILNAHDVVVKNGGYSIGIVGAMLDAARATQQATKCGGRPAFDMLAHLQRQREFSERTFGPGPRTKGVCDHIRKELAEIESNPTDLTEWIDVVILALDGAWRAGAWPQQIIETLVAKQTKNEGRDWPDWRTADPDKAIEHDRSKDATTPSPVAGSAGQAPWVSVADRLPEPDMPVLAHNGKWTGVAAWMSGNYVEPIERWQDEHREFIELMGPSVTHWMPIPAAPGQTPTAPSLTTDAGAVLTDEERRAISLLIDLARATHRAWDDSEEGTGDDGRFHAIGGGDFDEVSNALEALEELPDDKPGQTLGAAGKAEWALRGLLAAHPTEQCMSDAARKAEIVGHQTYGDGGGKHLAPRDCPFHGASETCNYCVGGSDAA